MRFLSVLLLCTFVWPAELLITIPAYAVGAIAGKDYAISRTWLYRKADVFRPVYQLPQPIHAARIAQNSIETPEYTLQVGPQITVIERKEKISAVTTLVTVVLPVTQLTTGNTVVIIAYDGLQLACKEGAYLHLLPISEVSADQLEELRLAFVAQKKSSMTRADRQYVRLLYRLETEKRREGAHDAYPLILPQ